MAARKAVKATKKAATPRPTTPTAPPKGGKTVTLWICRNSRDVYYRDDEVPVIVSDREPAVTGAEWERDAATGLYRPTGSLRFSTLGASSTNICADGFKKVFGFLPKTGAPPLEVTVTVKEVEAATAEDEKA